MKPSNEINVEYHVVREWIECDDLRWRDQNLMSDNISSLAAIF